MERVAFITGGSRGIGAAAARLFARAGYRVALGFCESRVAAEQLKAEILAAGQDAHTVRCDVRSEAEICGAVAAAEELGALEVVINSAGAALFGQIQDMTALQMQELLAVNTLGTMLVCREAAKRMIRQKSGCILNISSMWGVVGSSCETVYSASKAAVIGFSRALAKELAPSGVRVNCIAPGVIDTDMNRKLGGEALRQLAEETPLGRLGSAEEVAEAALYLAGAEFVTGQVLTVDGGFAL